MKKIKLFEDFKRNYISVDDIVSCIKNGGVLYTDRIQDFPDHDPENPVSPLSVDEQGLTTVELDGNHYEVQLKNIDRLDW
jgi:hypothetical protein